MFGGFLFVGFFWSIGVFLFGCFFGLVVLLVVLLLLVLVLVVFWVGCLFACFSSD